MSKSRQDQNKNIKEKPELHVDSKDNPRVSDFKNMSGDRQQAQFFNEEERDNKRGQDKGISEDFKKQQQGHKDIQHRPVVD